MLWKLFKGPHVTMAARNAPMWLAYPARTFDATLFA
jgi:hypothetical protein